MTSSDEVFLLSLHDRPPSCIKVNQFARKLAADYKRKKNRILGHLFPIFNSNIFNNQLRRHQIKVLWSKKLITKLGVTQYSFKRWGPTFLYIKLSSRRLDTAHRLYHTFLHELCHVANVQIDRIANARHSYQWNIGQGRQIECFQI